jgi:hypothetical protein
MYTAVRPGGVTFLRIRWQATAKKDQQREDGAQRKADAAVLAAVKLRCMEHDPQEGQGSP